MKNRIYQLLKDNKLLNAFIYGLIITNTLFLILETYENIELYFQTFFYYFELFSVFIFTIEYVLRIYSSTSDPIFKSKSNLFSRTKFILSTSGIIDLLAILPFYLPFILPFDLRMLRLFRLLRVLKLSRYSKSLKTISNVLKDTKSELVITIFIAFIFLILSSTLMYYFEHEAQPDKFANVGESLWWAVATLTTVGYGDIYPVTGLGKFMSGIIALIGIGFIALPTGIISSAFINRVQKNKDSENKCKCPNCGTLVETNQT